MKRTLLFLLLLISQTFSQADCTSALSVCGNSSITYSPSGIGAVNESLGGCLTTGEHNSDMVQTHDCYRRNFTFDLVPERSCGGL